MCRRRTLNCKVKGVAVVCSDESTRQRSWEKDGKRRIGDYRQYILAALATTRGPFSALFTQDTALVL